MSCNQLEDASKVKVGALNRGDQGPVSMDVLKKDKQLLMNYGKSAYSVTVMEVVSAHAKKKPKHHEDKEKEQKIEGGGTG